MTLDVTKVETWLSNSTGLQRSIVQVTPLLGGISTAMYQLDLSEGAPIVIRQFTNKAWLEEEPELARHEADSLRSAARSKITAPAIIAYDGDGTACGLPTVAMTHLSGKVELHPQNMESWLQGLADTLAKLHSSTEVTTDWTYYRYRKGTGIEPDWSWSSVPDIWTQALARIQLPPPPTRTGFIHRDYHPNNVLWHNGQVTGVVDWVNACNGPLAADTGHCRINLALLYGVKEADRFLHYYREFMGKDDPYHPYWDLVSLGDGVEGPPQVYKGWTDLGLTGLSNQLMAERLDQYLVSVIKRMRI
ncbi:phosphotransferase family protein [Paenibacillus swuensis]|uniref:phosphotransferase family protein n=1 Tax=Paenibacillus swuensis TaxID=1178515 RepID=UPI000A8E8102|nr:aminoglycoside phosphotransferase family protein [Paenibacillus swuensis]